METATEEKMDQNMEQAKSKGRETWENTTNWIRNNPGEAVAIAAAAGLAFGLLAVAAFGRDHSVSGNFKDIGRAGNDAWKELRSGFEEALSEMKCGFEKAMDQLRS